MVACWTHPLTAGLGGGGAVGGGGIAVSSSEIPVTGGVSVVTVVVDIGTGRVEIRRAIGCGVEHCGITASEGAVIGEAEDISSLVLVTVGVSRSSDGSSSHVTGFQSYIVIGDIWSSGTG